MPMPTSIDTPSPSSRGLLDYAYAWGGNSVPPTLAATLITAQHFRPFQTLPMLFPPVLLFSSYLNMNGFQKDAAGLSSAWSAAYIVLAQRRKQALRQKFGARGLIRGTTLLLCAANVVGGGLTYAFGVREEGGEE